MASILATIVFAITVFTSVINSHTAKISPELQEEVRGRSGNVHFMVDFCTSSSSFMEDMKTMKFPNRALRLMAARERLQIGVLATQRSIVNILELEKTTRPTLKYKTFITANRIYVEGADERVLERISESSDVCSIRKQAVATIPEPLDVKIVPRSETYENTWGVEAVNAPQAWEQGYTGKGIVVGVLDTGCMPTHEALRGNIRRSFSWHDAFGRSTEPYDDHGHGTHVTGTIVGYPGIGVAPGAEFMSCKCCTQDGDCPENAVLECLDYMACPYTTDGTEFCHEAPHIISASWGGGEGDTTFTDAIQTCRDAGIVPVFSAGNNGSHCGTVNSPGDSPIAVAVGATEPDTSLAYFSGRGPSIYGGIKPDISAPGVDIRSAYPASETSYATASGTSMAAPHVAGMCAILLQKYPALQGRVNDFIPMLLRNVQNHGILTSAYCGGNATCPNNYHGYGIVQYKST